MACKNSAQVTDGMRGRKSGSHVTQHWSKPDSNSRSHPLTRRQTHGLDRMNGAERDTVCGVRFAGDSRSRSHQT